MNMSIRSIPEYRYPYGWFQIGWSHDLQPGEVKALKYFGEDLVLWRGESGKTFLQDAFCLHIGAHRGIQGSVVGEDLQCPVHGWLWNGEGRNVHIPFSRVDCLAGLQARTYPVVEWYGMIMAWWHWDAVEPPFELPEMPELETNEWYPMHPHSSVVHRIKAHPQNVVENVCDPFHIPFVHGAKEPPRVERLDLQADGFDAELVIPYGAGKKSTRLTPDGPVDAHVKLHNYCLALGTLRWEFPYPTLQISSMTPVDEEHLDYFFQQTSKRVPGTEGDEPVGMALEMLKLQQAVIQQDFFLWVHMKNLSAPAFAPEEAENYTAFREWAWHFYPEENH
ncbi:MAG: (2Fe-2S)-binding protein [Deltaproteobacteria bacterium]|nr:(2Fe-2S)-binding protein [Deltaproteobacteria bacterium]